MPSEIIADSQATSPGIRRHALLALDVPPEAQESGGAELSGGAPCDEADEGLAGAGAADQQGVPPLGGEQPVG